MKENQITLLTDEGNEELAEILFTHQTDDKNYVVFELLESKEVSAAIYIEKEDGEGELLSIENDEEWEMLNDLLDNYFDNLEDEEEE